MYNDKLEYNVVIWAFFGISLWKEKNALSINDLWSISQVIYSFNSPCHQYPNNGQVRWNWHSEILHGVVLFKSSSKLGQGHEDWTDSLKLNYISID